MTNCGIDIAMFLGGYGRRAVVSYFLEKRFSENGCSLDIRSFTVINSFQSFWIQELSTLPSQDNDSKGLSHFQEHCCYSMSILFNFLLQNFWQ